MTLFNIVETTSDLLYLEKRIISNSECSQTFGIISEDMICAKDPTGGFHDVCAVSTKSS